MGNGRNAASETTQMSLPHLVTITSPSDETMQLSTFVCLTPFLSTSSFPGGAWSLADSWLPALPLCQVCPGVMAKPNNGHSLESRWELPPTQYVMVITATFERKPVPTQCPHSPMQGTNVPYRMVDSGAGKIQDEPKAASSTRK